MYRAHDLELGQPVALKFLTGPAKAGHYAQAVGFDERARARLRNEVRLARQLAHPNVCRVYDIGEAHGDLYLSMEYVDGEDLAALLKRIGRVPTTKGSRSRGSSARALRLPMRRVFCTATSSPRTS